MRAQNTHRLTILCLLILGTTLLGCNREPAPEEVIADAIKNMTEVNSVHYEGDMRVDINGEEKDPPEDTSVIMQAPREGSASIQFSGATELGEAANPKAHFTFSFSIESESLPEALTTFVFAIETLSINKIVYMRITEVPDFGDMFNLSSLKNIWIKMDPKEMMKKYANEESTEQVEEKEKQELTEEQIEEIRDVFKRHIIFRVTEVLDAVIIDGIESYHYRYEIDGEALYLAIEEINAIAENEDFDEEKLEKFKKNIEKSGLPSGEIWIGKKDLLFRKIAMIMDIAETEENKRSGSFDTTISFSEYNEPVEITEPTEFMTVEEVVSQVMMGMMMGLMPQETIDDQLSSVIIMLLQEQYEAAEVMLQDLETQYPEEGDRIASLQSAIEKLKSENDPEKRLEILSGLGK